MSQINELHKSQIHEIQRELSILSSQALNNIDLIIARGENINILSEKSKILSEDAIMFNRQSKRLKHRMWVKNVKIKLFLLFIILLIILILLFLICGIKLKC